jgi:hypothetical protein
LLADRLQHLQESVFLNGALRLVNLVGCEGVAAVTTPFDERCAVFASRGFDHG